MTGSNNTVGASTDFKQGTVAYLNNIAGYGFVSLDTKDEDVFFDVDEASVDEISEDDRVEANLENTKYGLRAVEIRLLDSEGDAL